MNRLLYSDPIWLTFCGHARKHRRNRFTGNWQVWNESEWGPSSNYICDRLTGPEAPILSGIKDLVGIVSACIACGAAVYLALFL
jgi:hypothetical protein